MVEDWEMGDIHLGKIFSNCVKIKIQALPLYNLLLTQESK